MSIVFNKGMLVMVTLQKLLMNITTSNGFNVTIQDVILYDINRYNKVVNVKLPALFMQGTEPSIEELTNDEFLANRVIKIFGKYQPEDHHNGVITDYSIIISAINKQLDNNICLNLDFVRKASVTSREDPLYLKEKTYTFNLTIDVDYDFCSSDP